jgi:hypothetical protein
MNRSKIIGSLYLMFFGVISMLASSCATAPSSPTDPRMMIGYGFPVKVDSIADPNSSSKGKTYLITSAMKDVSDNDLQFQEFARYIANALSPRGFVRTDDTKSADLLIRLGYGIGNPQTSTKTVVTSYGYSYPVGWMWFTVPPSTETVEKTWYTKTLVLEAYDLKDPKKQTQLWKTTAQTEGPQSDLRIMLAYIIAASADYFGTNQGRQIDVHINGDDPRVLDIWK